MKVVDVTHLAVIGGGWWQQLVTPREPVVVGVGDIDDAKGAGTITISGANKPVANSGLTNRGAKNRDPRKDSGTRCKL